MLLSVLLATVLAAPLAQAAPARQALTIPRVTAAPRLEDYLSGERRDGVSADAFLQREPQDSTSRSIPISVRSNPTSRR